MHLSYCVKERPLSRQFVINPSGNEASIDAETTCAPKQKNYLAIPQARPLTPAERCSTLIKVLKKRTTNYTIPKCLFNIDEALLYQSIVAHNFFGELNGGDRSKILDGILAFNELQGKSTEPRNLSATTLIEWSAKALDVSRVQASLVMGDLMHLSPERCFQRFRPGIEKGLPRHTNGYGDVPQNLVTAGHMFVLRQCYPIRAMDRQPLQMACRYSSGSSDVTVFADRSRGFGALELPAFLPARDLIEANPKGIVHFCLCSDVTWRYIGLARDGKLAEREGVIVTGNFGSAGELWAIDLSPLLFRTVVIVCPKERQEYNNVEKFVARCLQSGASSVRIFSGTLTL